MKNLRELVDSKVEQAGGNTRLGYQAAGEVVEGLLDSGKLKPSDFSIRQLFDQLVDVDLGESAVDVAEGLNTSAFPTIAQKIIHKDILDEYNLAIGDVGNLVSESEATHVDSELVAGFNAADATPLLRRQAMAYEETDFGEKDWKIIMADFGRMISLTREVIFEDRTGEVLRLARDIGRAGGQHKAKMIIQTVEVVNRDAFEETSSEAAIHKGTALAAATLYSDDHTALDTQVNDNLVASNALVDYTDVDAVYQLFAKMVDEAGNPIDVVPSVVLIPTALKATAAEIFKSAWLMAKGSTDALNIPTFNPIADLGAGDLNIISSIFLADTTTWYLGAFDKQLLWLNVFMPATASQGADSELAFTNQIVARFRFSYHAGVGHTDWRYIVKSTV